MAYCTQADLLEQIPESDLIDLTDDDGAGIVDTSAVTRAIADADAEIDAYCKVRYEVPFSGVPVMVRKCSVDIAAYNLFARRGMVPDDRKERYDSAVRFLREVSKGLASLGGDAPAADDDGGPEASSSTDDRIFSIGGASDGSSGSLDNY